MTTNYQSELQDTGFAIIKNVLESDQITRWIEALDALFLTDQATIKNRQGAVYAARNILSALPSCCDISRIDSLTSVLKDVLGEDYGLVRGLYFDKHPERTWSLPWHKDLTIAVKDNTIPTTEFSKPTTKSGVAHVEAPESILSRMLTLRIHLDQVTESNGPLEVAVGSHANGKRPDENHKVEKILVNSGDVLAMRPMLSHASGSSDPNTDQHRRILHLEFAADRNLPDGYQWHQYL
jgi:ectoine hydroxylase-related dioxygenase (phytanoyl-CoA dioxygenase family)